MFSAQKWAEMLRAEFSGSVRCEIQKKPVRRELRREMQRNYATDLQAMTALATVLFPCLPNGFASSGVDGDGRPHAANCCPDLIAECKEPRNESQSNASQVGLLGFALFVVIVALYGSQPVWVRGLGSL